MELELQDDQELFVETTRRFLEAESPLTHVRDLYDDPVAASIATTGAGVPSWAGPRCSSPRSSAAAASAAAGLLDLVLVAEEMGRLVSPGPLLPVNVVADTLARSGRPDQQRERSRALVAGSTIATWAFAEASGRWDASRGRAHRHRT